MTLLKSYRRSIRAKRRPPVPIGKPARLTAEQARAGGQNKRKAKSR